MDSLCSFPEVVIDINPLRSLLRHIYLRFSQWSLVFGYEKIKHLVLHDLIHHCFPNIISVPSVIISVCLTMLQEMVVVGLLELMSIIHLFWGTYDSLHS